MNAPRTEAGRAWLGHSCDDGEEDQREHILAIEAEAASLDGPTVDAALLRERLRAMYKDMPDSSHGEDYRNSGIVAGLRIVADLASDLDLEAPCEPENPASNTNWCNIHIAPMGFRWSCDLARNPWVWHSAALGSPEEPR